MKLIVNADDFGLSKAVNYGIVEAHKNGIVTSTTALVNGEAFQDCKKLQQENPNLSIGIHLNITLGKSLSGLSTLTDELGYFFPKEEYIKDFVKEEEDLYKEWKLQMEQFIRVMGCKPSHIDSHHHTHLLPCALPSVQKLAKEYGLSVRGASDIELNVDFYGDNVQEDFFERLEQHEKMEMMVHPAFVDSTLMNATSYSLARIKEYDILTSKDVKKVIKELGIQLVNYKEV